MGLSDEEKNMTWCVGTGLSSLYKMDITPGTNPPPNFTYPPRCKKMAASLRCVTPLGPHFWLSTDSPLPRERATSSAAWGRPPDAQLNMLTGRDRRGENHIFAIPHLSCCVRTVRLPFLLWQGKRKESRKLLQLTITLITIAQNKSQAEKSLDGNCYNCPNNGNGYFSMLNYMDLIFKYTICQFSPVELGSNRFKYLNHSH